jgi:hypothetical protein
VNRAYLTIEGREQREERREQEAESRELGR